MNVAHWSPRSLLLIMMKVAAFSLVSLTLGAPDLGCFYVKLPFPEPINVEAQIELKAGEKLDFDVVANMPNMGLDFATKCADEKFTFDAAASTITVGQEPLSPCLSNLQAMSRGAVATPVVMSYTASTLSARIVIPIVMNKIGTCMALGTTPFAPATTPSATVAPTGTTAAAAVATTDAPANTMTPGGAAAGDITTTTGSSAASMAVGAVFGAVLIALL